MNQNWIVENLNNAFSTWNGKLGELWGLVTTGPQTFKGGAVWSVMQTLHNGMVGIGYALVVLFFAISLCKNTMNFHELKRPEAAIHYFLRFVAAKALVGYGMDIIEDHFKYRQTVMEVYPCGHYPVFEGYDHMQYQIRDPKGFAEMLAYIAEHDGMPKLPFIRKCEDPI